MFDDFDDCAMPRAEFELLKGKVKECIDSGWTIKDVVAEIYNIYQEYLISEEQEGELYEIADPEELYNSPAEYWFNDEAGCLPLWEFVKEIMEISEAER